MTAMRILIVEDDREAASYLVKAFSETGHVADHAGDGLDGFAMARDGNYDAMVVDRMMPRLDGWETFQKIREMDPEARVVIASGDLDRQQLLDMRESGLQGSIRKPYSAAEVMKTVRGILDR